MSIQANKSKRSLPFNAGFPYDRKMVKINQLSVDSDLNRHHSKYEDPLWDNEMSMGRSINIILKENKHSKKETQWEIFESGKYVLTIRGSLLSLKQIKFLESSDGMIFLLNKYKEGFTNASKLIFQIKNETSNKK